jgi:uncharacterized protein with HEPN domain
MPRDNAHVGDILDAARAIQRFIAGISKAQFPANEEKYEAVNRKFEIIGEAAKRPTPEIRSQFPEIPGSLVAAMRDVLIHDYDDVNLDTVWKTATEDLPLLIARLEACLEALPPRETGGPARHV